MGSPRKPMMLLGWCYSIFRALAVIPGKENGESKGRRERGMKKKEKEEKDERKERQQRESESRTWVVMDEMLLNTLFLRTQIYMLF